MSHEMIGKVPLSLVKFIFRKIIRKKHFEYNRVSPPKLTENWSSLGNIEEYKKIKNKISVLLTEGEMEICSIDEGILQIKIAKNLADLPITDTSLLEEEKPPLLTIRKKGKSLLIQQKSQNSVLFNLEVTLDSSVIKIMDGFEIPLFFDSFPIFHELDWFYTKKRAGIACEHYFGFGEKTGPLDKRGEILSFWNTDSFMYSSKDKGLYQSQPIQIAVRENSFCYAVVYDNPYRSQIRIKNDDGTCFTEYFVNGGGINYYLVLGPSIEGLYLKLSKLLGKSPLPPLSALGNHQSRWSYYPESEVRKLASEFRKRRIPCDFIHLDIDYLDEYKVFTFNKERFPNPKKLVSELREQGFKIMTITDPGIKVDSKYFMYKEGVKGKHFCLNPDKSLFVGDVWPGPCHFPDFTQKKTREWFGGHFSALTDVGVEGFWLDMNEPSIFSDIGTMPDEVIHPSEGKNEFHAKIHNQYGHLMTKAAYEGLKKLRPNKRNFIISRSVYLGTHRYGGTWTGDNSSEWSQLRLNLPMLMNMAISGQVMIGPDIGGFVGKPSGKLLTRWYQAASFFPYYRNHTISKTCKQEPWVYGKRTEKRIKKAIQQRYSFLPYIYTSIKEACSTGFPAFKPLWLDFPKDPITYLKEWSETEYLFGKAILVAPMLRRFSRKRKVYLPRGKWYSFEGKPFEGGQIYKINVPLDTLPIFIKAGTIIPYIEDEIQFTEQIYKTKINLRVYPKNNESQGEIYLDDGISLDYEEGDFERARIVGEKKARGTWYFNIEREGKKKKYIQIGDIQVFGEEKSNYLIFEK
ncbi:MAG: glycoside hydrolase family 31 protein [Candidatus Heimdallarchaeaceae archaeon]